MNAPDITKDSKMLDEFKFDSESDMQKSRYGVLDESVGYSPIKKTLTVD
jgi:hypothetical protein